MAADHRLLRDLHRLFLNGKLREWRRDGSVQSQMAAPLSAHWLQLDPTFPRQSSLWDQAKAWQAILQGIAQVASIIYGPRSIQVVFDEHGENDLYEPQRTGIIVSTEPALRPPPGYTIYHAVDAMIGQVIHEAAHIRERRQDAPSYTDDAAMSVLYHLVEDVIVDRIICLEYPGFEGYLLAYRRFFIDWKLRRNWGIQAEDRLKQLVLAMRSTMPDRSSRWTVRQACLYLSYCLNNARSIAQLQRIDRARVAARLYAILYDAKAADYWSEPDVLSETFVLGMDGPPTAGEQGNNRGGGEQSAVTRSDWQRHDALHSESPPEDVDSDDGEPEAIRQTDAVKQRRRRLVGKWAQAYEHCAGKGGHKHSSGLSAEVLMELRRLTTEERVRLTRADGEYEAQLARIPLHAQAAGRYAAAVKAVRPHIAPLQRALADIVQAPRQRDMVALRSGSDLDEDALYRAKFAADLFKHPVQLEGRAAPLDIALLIDASYSMKEPLDSGSGSNHVPKYIIAQRIAALLTEALAPIDAMRLWVFSYSSLARHVEIRDLYSPRPESDKTRIGDLYPAHQTPEYQALLAVSRFMREAAKDGAKQLYIVLSDGCPADDTMPRDRQTAAIAHLTRKLEAAGNAVFHIALGSVTASERLYTHRYIFAQDGYHALTRQVVLILEKMIRLQT